MLIRKPVRHYEARYPQNFFTGQYFEDCRYGNVLCSMKDVACETCNSCNTCGNNVANQSSATLW